MFPYLLLIFVPLLFAVVATSTKINVNQKERSLAIGSDPKIMNNSLLVPVFFLCFFALLALRDESIGCDLVVYHEHFDEYAAKEFSEVFFKEKDPLYWLLNWCIGQITSDFRWFIIIVALLILFPIAKAYCNDREHGFLKVLLFVNLPTFVMMFSGLRQSLAMAFGLLAYEYVRQKKLIRFLIVALIAFGFHHTGFIIFLFYPMYHLPIKTKHLMFVAPGMVLTFLFNKPIFTFATDLFNRIFGEDYDATITSTGAYTMLILFVMLAVFAYVIPDEKTMDRDTLGLRNFLLVSVLLQCFAPLHPLAMRMNYYFILFIPMVIPKVLKYAKPRWAAIAVVGKTVMVLFFLAYYLFNTYVSCMPGNSTLNTHPYVPFW